MTGDRELMVTDGVVNDPLAERSASAGELAGEESETFLQAGRRRFIANRAGVAAAVVIVGLILLAVAAPFLTRYDPNTGVATDRLLKLFSPGHPLGTDEQGRDMATRLLYGGRASLFAGLVPVLLATAIGAALGTAAGFVGGRTNTVIMRTMDMLYGFPSIMVAIAIATALGPGIGNIVLALTVAYVPPLTRMVEQETRRIRSRGYIVAAEITGAGSMRIIRTQVLANIFVPILVYASSLAGLAIVLAAGMSFIGLGPPPPTAEWGNMLQSLRGSIYANPWVTALPGLMIFITSMALNILADAMADALVVKE